MHCDLHKMGDGYSAHSTRLVSGFNSPIGIELEGNALYVLETGLEGTGPSPPEITAFNGMGEGRCQPWTPTACIAVPFQCPTNSVISFLALSIPSPDPGGRA